ncbi:GtrA family protein [Clostridium sp. AF37-5AT]|nr:GtrA family protein [Clostridium sp. AF37-5AT]RHO94554.1 GtrA family protein [Clostridium sp. AF37-5AT]
MKEKYGEIVRYLIVGILTTVVSLGTYYGCVFTFLNPENALQLQLANVLSWIIAVTFAYATSRIYVFQSKQENILREMAAFYSSRLLTLFMDMAIMFIMVTLCRVNDKLAKLVVQVVVTVANYVFSKIFVFRRE